MTCKTCKKAHMFRGDKDVLHKPLFIHCILHDTAEPVRTYIQRGNTLVLRNIEAPKCFE